MSMFRTPKRNQQRPPKKGHKAEQDKDIKGVGVRGEVTPEICSTSNDPSLMRANAATRHERSGPYAKPKHESSERPEDAIFNSQNSAFGQVNWVRHGAKHAD